VLESSIAKMQDSNEKKLEEMRATVDEKLTSTLTTRLDSSFKTVSEQLEKLYKSLGEMQTLSSGVTENVSALNRVLTNVKARGTWAEVQLQGILDQTIPGMYETNVATAPNSAERVEFAIKIPSSEKGENDILLPLDSKFPMEDYIRLNTAADSADAEAVKEARKALEARVLKEAKDISKYIHIPNTTPFAIMYLATEGLYAEIASSRTGLPEKIQRDYSVMIAGPSTITALLNSLSMGFKTVAINEKANEVRELLSAVKTQYDKFDGLLLKARKKIDEAGKTIDDAQSRNNLIQKKLRTVEALDSVSAEKVLSDGFSLSTSDDEN
nr:DNA recombination protein RmuC [Oscillospiraceae bacterium]